MRRSGGCATQRLQHQQQSEQKEGQHEPGFLGLHWFDKVARLVLVFTLWVALRAVVGLAGPLFLHDSKSKADIESWMTYLSVAFALAAKSHAGSFFTHVASKRLAWTRVFQRGCQVSEPDVAQVPPTRNAHLLPSRLAAQSAPLLRPLRLSPQVTPRAYPTSYMRRVQVHVKIVGELKPEDLPEGALKELLFALSSSKPLLEPRAAVREGCIVISAELVTCMPSAASGQQEMATVQQVLSCVIGWLGRWPGAKHAWEHGTKLNLQVNTHLCKCIWHSPTQEWQHCGIAAVPARFSMAAMSALHLPLLHAHDLACLEQHTGSQGHEAAQHTSICVQVMITALDDSPPVTILGWDSSAPAEEEARWEAAGVNQLRLIARVGSRFCARLQVLEQSTRANGDVWLKACVTLPVLPAKWGHMHLELWHHAEMRELLEADSPARISAPCTSATPACLAPGSLAAAPAARARLCSTVAASCSVLLAQSDSVQGVVRELQTLGPGMPEYGAHAAFVADLADWLQHTATTGFARGPATRAAHGAAGAEELANVGCSLLHHAITCGWPCLAQFLLDGIMGPLGLAWPQVVGWRDEQDSRPHHPQQLLHLALLSGSPGMVHAVLQWGRQHGGWGWRWQWLAEGASCGRSCAAAVRALPAEHPLKQVVLADPVEGPALRQALVASGGGVEGGGGGPGSCTSPGSATKPPGSQGSLQEQVLAALLACVKGFSDAQREADYRNWCREVSANRVLVCCKLMLTFAGLGIIKSMSHTLTSVHAISNDMPVLLVYALPYACVLASGREHPRAQKVFLVVAKLIHFMLLLLIGSSILQPLLVTHLLHGSPYFFLIGWMVEPFFFRVLHQVQLPELLVESMVNVIAFKLIYSIFHWPYSLLMAACMSLIGFVAGVAVDMWNRLVYLQQPVLQTCDLSKKKGM